MMEGQDLNYTIAHFRGVAAEGLLDKAGRETLTMALILTPDACLVARFDGAALNVVEDNGEVPADLSRAYEIRAFGPKVELRWTRDGRTGEAILLAEGHLEGAGGPNWTRDEAIDVLTRTYRVWGEPIRTGASAPPGWTALSTGRIGTIYVPLPVADDEEVALKAKECVVRGSTGNAVVLFERLVRLEAVASVRKHKK